MNGIQAKLQVYNEPLKQSKSTRLQMFLDISSLWKFRNMHRKTPVLGSLFNKVAGLQICNLFKNKPLTHVFPVDIVKFLRTALFIENLWWPLLTVLPQ